MEKYIKNINNLCFSVTLSSLGVYFGYKSSGNELPGFLYIALASLVGLIITSLIIHSKNRKERHKK